MLHGFRMHNLSEAVGNGKHEAANEFLSMGVTQLICRKGKREGNILLKSPISGDPLGMTLRPGSSVINMVIMLQVVSKVMGGSCTAIYRNIVKLYHVSLVSNQKPQ